MTAASGEKDESRFWDILAQDDLFKKEAGADGGPGGVRRRNSGGVPRAADEDMGQEPPRRGERGRLQAQSTSDLMDFDSGMRSSDGRRGMGQ